MYKKLYFKKPSKCFMHFESLSLGTSSPGEKFSFKLKGKKTSCKLYSAPHPRPLPVPSHPPTALGIKLWENYFGEAWK